MSKIPRPMILHKLFLNRCQSSKLAFGQLIKYKIRTSSFVHLKFFQKSKKKVKDNKGIRGGEFDDVSFSITMRATGFENSFGSISYVP
jgi:hypothetical protein